MGTMSVLNSIKLKSFRNFSEEQFFFPKPITVIVGKNARGKTNLLEAIHVLNTGNGFREKKLEELIEQQKNGLQISGKFTDPNSNQSNLSLFFQKSGEIIKKSFLVNNLKKTYSEYRTRVLPVVLFEPNNLEFMVGTPSYRRHFFDRILAVVDYQYYRAKNNYERALYKRNKLLENFLRDRLNIEAVLPHWDELLIKEAQYLQSQREKLVDYYNRQSSLETGESFFLQYLPSLFNQQKMDLVHDEELRLHKTLIGPQLDDFAIFKINSSEKKLSSYGSRSEQRLGILWLKLIELKYLEQELQKKPLLLLDDIFSEFDLDNSHKVLSLCNNYQTFITTTQKELVKDFKDKACLIEIN